MHESYFKGTPWRRFMEFISPAADRFAILREPLEEAALGFKVIEAAGNRHFIAAPSEEAPRPRRPPAVLVAHYDRAEGSPGANDNSAGVFLLIETAMKLKKKNENNWIVIFTDKEELKPGERIEAQGSYSLAAVFKNSPIENARIFCFDTCGVGDTMLISTTLESLLKKEGSEGKLRSSVLALRQSALDTARDLGMSKVLLAPTPFSDDLGFFRAGIAAQTITMLPSEECLRLFAEIRRNRDFADILISAESREKIRSSRLPETWRGLNSPVDSPLRLTPENYRAVIRFAEALCSG